MPGLLAWRARLGLSTIRRPSSMAASVVARPLSSGTGSVRFRSARAPLHNIALSALQGGEGGARAVRRGRVRWASVGALESPTSPRSFRDAGSFRGSAKARARNPFSRGPGSWIPGCLAPLDPRNDHFAQGGASRARLDVPRAEAHISCVMWTTHPAGIRRISHPSPFRARALLIRSHFAEDLFDVVPAVRYCGPR